MIEFSKFHTVTQQDLLFTDRTFENSEEIRNIYLLHVLNHVLKLVTRLCCEESYYLL